MQCSELERFLLGAMSVDERIQFADHLAVCPRCCGAMADAFLNAGNPLLSSLPLQPSPPRGITERITRELYLKRRREFRVYTLQVILSACAAIVLIFAGNGKLMNLRDLAEARAEARGFPGYALSDTYQTGSPADFYTEVLHDANTKK